MFLSSNSFNVIKRLVCASAVSMAFISSVQAAPETVAIGPSGEAVTLSSTYQNNSAISANGAVVVFEGSISGQSATPVWARNRQTASTQLLSKDLGGQAASGNHRNLSISADGRYVVFESAAANLVSDDTNNSIDLFLADRNTGLIKRIDVSTSGQEASVGGGLGAISADGRYVAFASFANDLDTTVPQNGFGYNVYVRDLVNNTTKRINITSTNTNGTTGSGWPNLLNPQISADGRFVIFYSGLILAPNGNGLYIRDQLAGTTTALPISAGGIGGGTWALSADGRYVSYYNSSLEIEVYDRQANTVEKLTTTVSNSGSGAPTSISASGRYVTYRASATANGTPYAVVYDRQTKTRANLSSYGATGSNAVISGDGRHIVVDKVAIANPLFVNDGFCSIYNPYVSQ